MLIERHPHILDRNQAVLVVVDMQEPFLNVMHERERLTANVRLLVEAAVRLHIPIVPTTQYAERMGGVIEEVMQPLCDSASKSIDKKSIDKMCFSCADSEEFSESLAALKRRQVLLCGVETHICVSQTALDLTHQGCQVHVAADAVSSRTLEKHKLGMERMRDSGVLPCAAEAAVYELLRAAGTPEFKAILPFVKS